MLTGTRCGRTTARRLGSDVDRATREELEAKLVNSYESYIAIKSMIRRAPSPALDEALMQEVQLQRYLHALLGHKGEPPGLLY